MSDQELIQSFLANSLSEDQLLLFNKRKEDPLFMEALSEATLEYYSRLELKKELQKIGKSMEKDRSKTNIFLYAAASVVLLISSVLFYRSQTYNDRIFKNHFEPFPNMYTNRGELETTNDFYKAMSYYDLGDFEHSNLIFKKIENTKNGLNAQESFYYGVSLLANKNIENAKIQLRTLENNHPLYYDAQWYLSLAYIKQDSVSESKKIVLKYINSPKSSAFKKLLKELE